MKKLLYGLLMIGGLLLCLSGCRDLKPNEAESWAIEPSVERVYYPEKSGIYF